MQHKNQQTGYSLKTRVLYFFPVLFVLVGLDQWTKIWAVENLKDQYPTSYFFGLFKLIYAENTGAWGNLGGEWGEPYRSLFLIWLPIIVLAIFAFASLYHQKLNKIEFWSYCFIVSGGLGNLIDRIRFNFVVDFMYAGIKRPFETNIFNIADVVIMTGFGFMILHLIQEYREKKTNQV